MSEDFTKNSYPRVKQSSRSVTKGRIDRSETHPCTEAIFCVCPTAWANDFAVTADDFCSV